MHPESQSKSFVFTSNGERVDVSYFLHSSPPERKSLTAQRSPEPAPTTASVAGGLATPRGSRGLYPPQLVQTAVASARQMNQSEPAGRGHTVF